MAGAPYVGRARCIFTGEVVTRGNAARMTVAFLGSPQASRENVRALPPRLLACRPRPAGAPHMHPCAVHATLRPCTHTACPLLSQRKPLITKPKGEWEHRLDDYKQFVKELSEARVKNEQAIRAERAAAAARRAAAAAASAQAAAAAERAAKRRRTSKLTDFGGFSKGDATGWNERISHDMSRLFYGEAIADAKADSPLLHTFVDTVLQAGAAGFTLPNYELLATSGEQPDKRKSIVLPTRQELGGSLLEKQHTHFAEALKERALGLDGTKVCGFGLTSDGTSRFSRAVMNAALMFKSGEVVFWDLKDTSGESKDKQWIANFVVDVVTSEAFPLDPMDLVTITMDGACRTSFPLIEKAFRDNPKLPSIVCQWCSCHTWQLLLKAIADIDGIDTLIKQCREVITFVRGHDKPTALLRKSAQKGLVRWVETRFGTIFICMERLVEVKSSLMTMVQGEPWSQYRESVKDRKVREELDKFVDLVIDASFWNKIAKTLELVEPIFSALRVCDSDAPTVGIVYQLFLETQQRLEAWEATKFENVKDGPTGVAFREGECSLLSKRSHEDAGLGAAAGWTAAEMLVFRWNKMHGATSTGKLHAAGRLLNPAFRDYDHTMDNLTEQFVEYLKIFGSNKDDTGEWVDKAFTQWQDYQTYKDVASDSDLGRQLFFNTDGTEKETCSWTGDTRGLRGADWWINLPFKWQQKWSNLREVAIKVLSQTSTESAAERHFSAIEVIQPKVRASLTPESVQKRSFVRAEIQGAIARTACTISALHTPDDLEDHDASGRSDGTYHDISDISD